MNEPLVSVCVPVYNCERFVRDAIDSVLAQTYSNFELVLLDNASTDNTYTILKSYTDSRVSVLRSDENVGAIGNFNKALHMARGEYLKILCADDFLHPTCLERQVGVMVSDRDKQIGLVCCGRTIVDERGRVWCSRFFPGASGVLAGAKAIRKTIRSGTNIFGEPSAVLLRTEPLKMAGEFDRRLNYCVDLDLWCRILCLKSLYVIREPLCSFRVSKASWSFSACKNQAREYHQFIEHFSQGSGQGLISRLDCMRGRVLAYWNALLRAVFYRIVFERA